MGKAKMADEGKTRESVAERLWINLAGEETSAEEATGFSYLDKPTGRKFVWQSGGTPGNPLTMLAIFGGLTKAGNIRSTLVNTKDNPSSDPVAGIEAWFSEIDSGVWASDRVGGGMRFNADVLATAIATAKGETDNSPYLTKITAKMKVIDPGDKNGKKEILYATLAYRNPLVKQKYHELLPATDAAPDLGDL